MPQSPSLYQITKAREFILRRISNQRVLEEKLESEFAEAATKIAQIVLKYKARGERLRFSGTGSMAREISQVLNELEFQIDRLVEYYCIPDEAAGDKNKENAIITHVKEADHGYTYKERETLYISNYLKSLITAGIASIDSQDAIEEMIRETVSKPERRLTILALNSIALGYAFHASEQAKQEGAVGFYVYPGSSNPCAFCQDKFYIFHPITEEAPPYHPNCRCVVVYVQE